MKNLYILTSFQLYSLALPVFAQSSTPFPPIETYFPLKPVISVPLITKAISNEGNIILANGQWYYSQSGALIWKEGIILDLGKYFDNDVNFHSMSGNGRFLGGYYFTDNNNNTSSIIFDTADNSYQTYLDFSPHYVSNSGKSFISTGRSGGSPVLEWVPSSDNLEKYYRLANSENSPINARVDYGVEDMDESASIAIGYETFYDPEINRFKSSSAYWHLDASIDAETLIANRLPALNAESAEGYQVSIQSYTRDISSNGNYIVGIQNENYSSLVHNDEYHVLYRPYLYSFSAPADSALTEIPIGTAEALGVSNEGRVVGTKFESSGSSAWVYDKEGSVRTINEWLEEGGSVAGNILFETATAISADGKVIAGVMKDSRNNLAIYSTGYIARYGVGAIDPREFSQTLEQANSASGYNATAAMSMAFNNAHHIPLQMQGVNRYAWITSDFARNDRFDTDLALAEAGSAIDLMDKQLVVGLGLGQSWAKQGLLFGGQADISGQYLLSELSYRGTGTPYIISLTAAHGQWDADITRKYLNAGLLDSSSGKTDVDSSMIRLRADWLDALEVLEFGISPKIEYSFNKTKTDGYTEASGSIPASYDAQSDSIHQIRYGFTAGRNVLDNKGIVRLRFEGVHRFDDGGSISLVRTAFDNFNTTARSNKQNWLLYGVDFEYSLKKNVTLTSGLSSSTGGQDPIFGMTLGARISF